MNRVSRSALFAAAALSSFGAMSAAGAAQAQVEEGEQQGLDKVVVTAQKRGEDIQDVPIAMAAIGGESLQESGVVNTLDIARLVPGLQVNNVFANSNPTIFLRGVGVNDYNPASAGAVGVTIDEVFLNSGVGQLFQIYDVDRLEVLKGPQGTLYGRNTTGGVINYFTNQATFTPDLRVSATYGRYGQAFLDAAVGGSIVDGLLAGRASVSIKRRDGWATNVVNGADQNDIDSAAGRLQLRFEPNESLRFDVKLEGGSSDASAYRSVGAGVFNLAQGRPCTGEEVLKLNVCANPISGFIASADPTKTATDVLDNYEKLENRGAVVRGVWTGDNVSLTSISAYVYNERKLNQDQDSSPVAVLYSPIWTEESEQVSQEIRLASDGDGDFNWVIGAYYLQDTLNSLVNFELLADFNPTPTMPYFDPLNFIMALERSFSQETTSRAAFAQFDYRFAPGWRLTVGARYTDDEKTLEFITFAGPVNPRTNPSARLSTPLLGLIDSNPTNFAIDPPANTVDELNEPTWNIALDYQLTPDVLLYGSYSRGVRGGGHNTGALISPIEFNAVRSEQLDAYQVGWKSDLLGRRLRFNGAAFYYDYEDMQVFSLEPGNPVPLQRLQNADAEIYGAEFELSALPIDELELNFSGAFLHTEYTQFLDALRGDFSGNRLDKAPEVQLAASAAYERSVGGDWTGHLAADVSYQSKIYFSAVNASPLVRGAITFVNLRAGLRNDSGFDMSLFVRNATDEQYLQDLGDQSSFGYYQMFFNEPRTYGVTLSYRR